MGEGVKEEERTEKDEDFQSFADDAPDVELTEEK